MHNNSFSKFGNDFPIAGLSVKQFIELCVSLGFGSPPNSYPNKPESPPPEIMGIDDVIRLTGYSKATIYKFTHQRLIPFHKPAHGGTALGVHPTGNRRLDEREFNPHRRAILQRTIKKN